MPTKEYIIKELKDRIKFMKDYYNKMEDDDSSSIMLGIIAMKICELEEKLEKLEGVNE